MPGFYLQSPNQNGADQLTQETCDDINSQNLIAGALFTGGHQIAAIGSSTTFFEPLSGSPSQALAINDSGQVVGEIDGSGGFVWSSSNGINGAQLLNGLLSPASQGWSILSANDINNNGQIVGLGLLNGQQYAVLLNPVPEPSSLALAALDFVGLAAWRLRRGPRRGIPRHSRLLACLASLLALVILAGTITQARAAYQFVLAVGGPSAGSGNGQFNLPTDVAVDSSGDVWVSDEFNHRIQEFSSTGAYIRQFGSLGTGNGQLN